MVQADGLSPKVSKQSDVSSPVSYNSTLSATNELSTQLPTGYTATPMEEQRTRRLHSPTPTPDDLLQPALPRRLTESSVQRTTATALEALSTDGAVVAHEAQKMTASQDAMDSHDTARYLEALYDHSRIQTTPKAGFDASTWVTDLLRSQVTEMFDHAICRLTVAATFKLTAEELFATEFDCCTCHLVNSETDSIGEQLDTVLACTSGKSFINRATCMSKATRNILQALPLDQSILEQLLRNHDRMRAGLQFFLVTKLWAARGKNKSIEDLFEEYCFTDAVAPFLGCLNMLRTERAASHLQSPILYCQLEDAVYGPITDDEDIQLIQMCNCLIEGNVLDVISLPDDQAYEAYKTAMHYITLGPDTLEQRQPRLKLFRRALALHWTALMIDLTRERSRPPLSQMRLFERAVGLVWTTLTAGEDELCARQQPSKIECKLKASAESTLDTSRKRRQSSTGEESTSGTSHVAGIHKARKASRPDVHDRNDHPQDLELGRLSS